MLSDLQSLANRLLDAFWIGENQEIKVSWKMRKDKALEKLLESLLDKFKYKTPE